MATSNRTTVVGVFQDRDTAERAVDELNRIGFRDDQIGFAWRGSDDARVEGREEGGTKAAEGLGTGAVVGGIIGAAASLLIPGVGPVIAGGILAPILGAGATAAGVAAAGAVAGAATGGLIGALAGMGIPEDEARYYQGEFEQGRVIVTVNAGDRMAEAQNILRQHGAYDVHSAGHGRVGDTTTTHTTTSHTTVTPAAGSATTTGSAYDTHRTTRQTSGAQDLSGTRTPTGARRNWADVRSEWRTRWQSHHGTSGGRWEDVEPYYQFGYESREDPRYHGRRFEEIQDQLRQDWSARGNRGDWDRMNPYLREMWQDDESMSVGGRETYEPAHQPGTSTRVGQNMGSTAGTPTSSSINQPIGRSMNQPVGGTTGEPAGHYTGNPRWNEVTHDWRTRWQSRHGTSGGRWEDVEPHYQFGHESHYDPRYRGRQFSDVEPELRRDWEARGNPGAWDRVKAYVREVWESGQRVV